MLAGVRVLLGNKPPDRIPSYIEVFGRRRQCNMAGNTPRWFDFPFTREESLQADKSLKIKCKDSSLPTPVVRSVHVHMPSHQLARPRSHYTLS